MVRSLALISILQALAKKYDEKQTKKSYEKGHCHVATTKASTKTFRCLKTENQLVDLRQTRFNWVPKNKSAQKNSRSSFSRAIWKENRIWREKSSNLTWGFEALIQAEVYGPLLMALVRERKRCCSKGWERGYTYTHTHPLQVQVDN